MSDPFDDLEREIGQALRARAGHRPRRWTRRTGALAVAVGLTVSGAAVAASGLVSGPDGEEAGRKIARQAVVQTADAAPCRPLRYGRPTQLVDAPLRPELARLLPALAAAPPGLTDTDRLALLPPHKPPGRILRQTVRRLVLSGGIELTVYVQEGVGFGAVADPNGCHAARVRRAEELADGRSDDVRGWALRRLAELRETVPGLQTLWVTTETGGAGVPVDGRRRLGPGALLSTGARGASVYVGFTTPGTARMRLQGARLPRDVARTLRVVDGFWAVRLPHGTGPVTVVAVGADGRPRERVGLRR